MKLRDYQQKSIDDLYRWFELHEGNPCLVMPTASGKSHVVAALCKDAIQNWPETRILMLTHVKELIEQNAEKMLEYWPNAPLGIYSAGVGIKQLGQNITFAGIQSIYNIPEKVGHIDLIIIDECHLVNHAQTGTYRTFIHALQEINSNLRVIGLTATPYRLGHGLITDKPALFDVLLEPVTISELVFKGWIAPLRSKHTIKKLDASNVKKRGGEYIESELQAAVDTEENNQAVVKETIERAGDRKAWLFFCSGVHHSERIARILQDHGISSACILGSTPKKERQRILEEYKAGKIRALTNANVLTTGFDYPDIDMIAMLRPTMSPGLYLQMAGRGMRLKSHTDHCLVLDFAGVVQKHGPITAVVPPQKPSKSSRIHELPMKACESCHELNPIAARECSCCGAPFPSAETKKIQLHNLDIMGIEGQDLNVTSWTWRKHISRTSGKEMLSATYYGGYSDPPVTEYFPVRHDGYAGQKATQEILTIARSAGVPIDSFVYREVLEEIALVLNDGDPPKELEYRKDGKFYRVLKRKWHERRA
jgi:DNA repair protein RadD